MQALRDVKRMPRTHAGARKPKDTSGGLASPVNRKCRSSRQKSPAPAAKATNGAPAGGAPRRSSTAFDCLWVAKLGGRIVGGIRLAQATAQAARLCEFRLDPEWRHTNIPGNLVCCLQTYCWDKGCLKLVVEAGDVPGWFRGLLNRRGFRLSRERTVAGRTVYEFCVDRLRSL